MNPAMPYPAPELATSQWFNAKDHITLDSLRGEVIVLETFQMLCPGCVSHGLPQALRIHQTFGRDLIVLGLHTVFEHHSAMTPVSLEAFLHEYRITFPVGVDDHEPGIDTPVTMRRYQLQGTPSLIVIDRGGFVRTSTFGLHDDLALGALLGRLLDEPHAPKSCDSDLGCAMPSTNATRSNPPTKTTTKDPQ